MSRRGQAKPPSWGGFPRVSGDEPALGMQGEQIQQFSPRERG